MEQVASIPSEAGPSLQRLFSTFPDGWPGFGLLLLRCGAGIALIGFGIAGLAGGQSLSIVLRLVAVTGGLLLLFGLWTPVAGMVVAINEVWSAFAFNFSQQDEQWLHLLLGLLAAGIAMLGPGAWSVDARLFGRKRFELNGRTHRKSPH